jgi:hypothetical protein
LRHVGSSPSDGLEDSMIIQCLCKMPTKLQYSQSWDCATYYSGLLTYHFSKSVKGALGLEEWAGPGRCPRFSLRVAFLYVNLHGMAPRAHAANIGHNTRKNACENKLMVSEKPMWAHFECSLIVLHGPNNNLMTYVCVPRRASKRFFRCHWVGQESQPGDTPDVPEWAKKKC